MNKSWFSKAFPHIIAVLIFLVVSAIYCAPALQGEVLNQHDLVGWRGMAQQSYDFFARHGEYPLWTNSMFSGMPAYQIVMPPPEISIWFLYKVMTLGLPEPICFFFLACICFYILCMVMRINVWISVLAAIAYSFSTYDPIIIAVGHVTKMQAIAYAPGMIAGLILLFRKQYLTGAALLTFFTGMQTGTNHVQILYYTLIIMGLLSLGFLYNSIREKTVLPAIKSLGIAAVSGTVGFLTYAIFMLPINEYVKETMRGGRSELTMERDQGDVTAGGLDKEYAFRWSYGIGETFTIVVPGIYGGSNGGNEFSSSSKFVEKVGEIGVPEDNGIQMANAYAYWGTQPNTSGPVYLGAVVCLLFILSLFFTEGWLKWSLLAAGIVGIVLAWGRNFSAVNYFLFDYLPIYNKFRAPSMSLVINQLVFPLLGALALNNIITGKFSKEAISAKLKKCLYTTAGLILVLAGFYFTRDYKGEKDNLIKENFTNSLAQQMARGQQPAPEKLQQAEGISQGLMSALREDRKSLAGKDLFRTIFLMAAAMGLVFLFARGKLKTVPLLVSLILLSSFDLFAVGRRYLNSDHYVDKDVYDNTFIPTAADLQIKADTSKHFRVFDQTAGDPYSDSRASYFHNSIGGYHAAKLGLYQDIISYQLGRGNMSVFNMLNTKYFIRQNPSSGQPVSLLNNEAFGPCWLVKNIHFVNNADEEMKTLDSIDLRDTAVIDKRFASVAKEQPVYDSVASLQFIDNLNDRITYKFTSKTPQFAVFSEVFYDKGWIAYLDGAKTDYCRVNYILRGMPVPAGDHTIEFRFEPRSYQLGSKLTLICTILTFLLLIAAGVYTWKKKNTGKPPPLSY